MSLASGTYRCRFLGEEPQSQRTYLHALAICLHPNLPRGIGNKRTRQQLASLFRAAGDRLQAGGNGRYGSGTQYPMSAVRKLILIDWQPVSGTSTGRAPGQTPKYDLPPQRKVASLRTMSKRKVALRSYETPLR
jgi:hypothetical protein